MDVNRNRNLLFGVFAVQLRGVLPEQLVKISAAWAVDPSISVAQRMVDKNILTPEDRAVLEKLVDDAILAHGGNSSELLALFGGEEYIERTYFSGLDFVNLDNVDTAPMEGGAYLGVSGQDVSGVNETPGRYTLISHHAKGGMGRVLIVHDEHLGRNIALKELMPTGASGGGSDKPTPIRQSASLVARFLQEARITSQLEHPAIVPVYELGRREDGTLYYTMRLVRGKTFAEALRKCGGLDERLRLLSNFVSLCQAIAYAHSRGIIHRDIKPANVMLGQFGETVVLDWGLAKRRDAEDIHVEDIKEALHSFEQADGEPPLTAYGRALGTPHYMPPEQAAGRIEAIDERSDIYSLGAVLYEILTGTTPHSGKNTREIIEKVLHESPLPVLQVVPDAPPELAVICEKALKRDSVDRYQTAAELAAEVERFIQGSLVRTYRYSPGQMLMRYYARHRPLVNTALACAAVLLVMGVASYVSILHARNREHDQRLAAEAARHDESIARADAERKTYQSQIHLAQARIREKDLGRANETLWETAEKERGWEWRYLLNRANPDIYTIEVPNSSLFAAVFSPDGTRIGTNASPAPPSIYEALTGKKLVTLEGGDETYLQTVFSPDGTKYVGVSREGTVSVWDTTSGRRLHHFALNAQGYSAVFDATGDFLFAGAGDGKVRVFDLQRGEPAYELNMGTGPVGPVVLNPGRNRLLAITAEETGGVAGQLWDLATKSPVFSIRGGFPVFSTDGARIATAQGMEAMVWDAETGAETARLKGHTQRIMDLCFNGDGTRLLTASQDGTLLLWDLASSKILQTYALPGKTPVIHAFFLKGEDFVLACSADNQNVLFNAQTGSRISQTQSRGQTLNQAALQPDGALLASTSDGRVLQVLNMLGTTGVESVVPQPKTKEGISYGISASASGKLIAFQRQFEQDGIRLVDTGERKERVSVSASFWYRPNTPLLSDDGSRLAMIVDGGTAAVVTNPASAKPSAALFSEHTASIASIALCADGTAAATGDDGGEICLWDTGSAQTIRKWKGHDGKVTRLWFSRDARRVLSCGLDGQIVLWSCDTGEKLRALPRGDKGIVSVALSDDETRVLAVDVSGSAQLWDVVRGETLRKTTSGDFLRVTNGRWFLTEVGFWPGGNRFITQSSDEYSRLWDTTTMTPLLAFDPGERVLPLRDGACLATADASGSLRVVRMPGEPSNTALTDAGLQQYKAEWGIRTAIDLPKGDCPTYKFISREDLARGLDGLIHQVEVRSQPEEAALRLAADTRTQAVAAMGLNVGDCITAVDDTLLEHTGSAKTALADAAARVSQDLKAGLSLSVSRNGHMRTHGYWTFPLVREEAAITANRDEALLLLQREIDGIPTQFERHPDFAWLPLCFPLQDVADAKSRLISFAILTAVDGADYADMAGLQRALLELKRRISAGEAAQFSQTFRDGVFRELVCMFTVAGA